MGKWAARLAAISAAPPPGGTDKTDRTPLLAVLAVGAEGGCSEISAPSLLVNDSLAETETDTARPYRLTAAEAATAHVDPWDDGAIARFQARAGLIRRRRFAAQDADDLAERLHLRDVHADYRGLCLECRHLSGTVATRWRCHNHEAARLPAELAPDLVTLLQHCDGFDERTTDAPTT